MIYRRIGKNASERDASQPIRREALMSGVTRFVKYRGLGSPSAIVEAEKSYPVTMTEKEREIVTKAVRQDTIQREIYNQASILGGIGGATNGVDAMSVASLGDVGQWMGEWYKDLMRGLDVLLPEELVGVDITPQARVGGEKKGRVYYDDVWVEDGKIKVIRKGNLRVLGYTPQEAKKRFKTRRRRKRLTKRDIYIIEALKDGASPAAVAML